MQAETKKKAMNLLKTARGQIDGIIKMLEDDRYCIDVSNQIMASEAVLSKANKIILHQHVLNCIKNSIESGDEDSIESKVKEIIQIIDKLA